MAKLAGTHHVVTASFTVSGAPVYLTAKRSWSRALNEAHLIESADACETEMAWALKQEAEVADPYSFMVTIEQGRIDPQSQKEAIRAEGPTTPIRRPD
jgi:hypothetical protein